MPDTLSHALFAAVRGLRRSPATTLTAVVTLALAVALNLAMFALIDRAILSPPAHVQEPDRIFSLRFEAPGRDGQPSWMSTASWVAFDTLRHGIGAADRVAAWQRAQAGALVDERAVTVEAMMVSGEYFDLLGARPFAGRALGPEDDAGPAGQPMAVIGHAFWTAAFGGDQEILGRTVVFRGITFTVAGVMPPGFGGHSAGRVDLWVPFHAAMRNTPGWDQNQFRNHASVLVRLRTPAHEAVAAEQATAALGRGVSMAPIGGAEIRPAEQRIAWWLAGVSLLVLILGLANAATLLLVRAAGRRQELAIRAALGASRVRLLAQVGCEAALLAAGAVAVSLVAAWWFDEAVRRVLLPGLVQSPGLDRRMLAAAAGAGLVAFLTAAAAAVAHVPDRFSPRPLTAALRGGWATRTRRVLLLSQTTLSVLLLAGAGLLGRSLFNLVNQDFGMRMHDVLLVRFDPGPGGPPDSHELFTTALGRVRALPGVERAAPIEMVPFTGFHVPPISVPGWPEPPTIDGQLPYLLAATPDLLEILDVRLIEGRRFVEADERGAPVVLVNESMARTAWPGQSALGKCIRIGFDPGFDPFTADGPPPPPTTVPCREVVGVVGNVRQRSAVPTGREADLMQYYVPLSQVPPPPMGEPGPRVQGLLLRASGSPDVLAGPIRRIVTGGRADLPFLQVRRYSDLLEPQMRPWRQGTTMLALFGALALIVAAVGLYAAFAHAVGERRREMAIRLAIGARPGRLLLMILREAAVLALGGVVAGSLLAIASGRWLQSMLVGTTAADPLVLAATAAVMAAIATVATWLPARSAGRADPTTLLRAE